MHYFHTVSRKNTVNLCRAIVSLHHYNAEWGEHIMGDPQGIVSTTKCPYSTLREKKKCS